MLLEKVLVEALHDVYDQINFRVRDNANEADRKMENLDNSLGIQLRDRSVLEICRCNDKGNTSDKTYRKKCHAFSNRKWNPDTQTNGSVQDKDHQCSLQDRQSRFSQINKQLAYILKNAVDRPPHSDSYNAVRPDSKDVERMTNLP